MLRLSQCAVLKRHSFSTERLLLFCGFSAFHTGLFTLPLAVMMTVRAPWSGRLVGSYGTRPSLLVSGAGFLLSTLMLTGLSQQTPVGWRLAAYALFGVGLGMVNPAITNSAVAGMPL